MAIKEMGEWIIFRISDLHGMTSIAATTIYQGNF